MVLHCICLGEKWVNVCVQMYFWFEMILVVIKSATCVYIVVQALVKTLLIILHFSLSVRYTQRWLESKNKTDYKH